jgi:tyrosyl-tRNA synthetase
MDPYLDAAKFVKQLDNEYEMYKSEYDTDVQKRFNAIRSIAEICDTEEELLGLVKSGKTLIAFNGFEPSGGVHIADAVITVLNANLLGQNGCLVKLYYADLFA